MSPLWLIPATMFSASFGFFTAALMAAAKSGDTPLPPDGTGKHRR